MSYERGTINKPSEARSGLFIVHLSSFIVLLSLCLCVFVANAFGAQIESVESTAPPQYTWVSHGRMEGHLALNYSPAGAFSPDSATLAIVSEERVAILDLSSSTLRKTLRPRVQGINDLSFHSANYVSPSRIFLLGNGLFQTKSKGATVPTPTLAFLWDPDQDALVGKVNEVGAKGGFAPPRFFPMIGYLGLYKETNFDLWHPLTGRGGRISIPELTRRPNLFEFSPDGHWLLAAQIEASGTDPVVVNAPEHKIVDSLRGHQGTVLSMAFSRDNRRVVTACEDGKLRVFSVGDWKLLQTLAGHEGAVHWAEFSPDGQWIVSGGEDKTVRVWSAAEGALVQTLSECPEPVRTVAFSPNGEYIAASTEALVLVWKRSSL
jgi:WD40 repeat protein